MAAALAVALGGVLASATAASAHDRLVGSDPAADATLDALPAQITLTFNDAVLADAGAIVIEVTDAAGTRLDEGTPSVSRATVTQPIAAADDANGVYSVAWKVVSGDGHPVSGEFSFTVAGAPVPTPTPTASAPTASPSPSATVLPGPPMEATGGIPPWIWAIVGVLVVALLGALVAVLVARARGRADGPPGQD